MSAHSAATVSNRPTVTLVMTCRERFRLTETAIESVMRNTSMPFRLLYADVGSPDWLRARLEQLAETWSFEIVRFDEALWPSQVRRRIASMIDTDYAVFMDNDVLVAPGWLEKLCECADQTGAGIVGPVYLWGDSERTDRIHMAGGELKEEPEAGGIVLREKHRSYNKKIGEVDLHRAECGFVEFHCMLMRRELFGSPEIFDDEIVCVHEHIHASLVARDMGYKTFVEPAAQVIYLSDAPYSLSDLDMFRQRWSHEAGERSIRAFAKRWNVIDDERSFGVRQFLVRHNAHVDPVRSTLQDTRIARTPMVEGDLKQTLSGLVELARLRGYTDHDLEQMRKAHWTATLLSNAGYRPCGRPFLNHLVGTASVLVHFGFEMRLVIAALLHAAYTHAPRLPGGAEGTVGSMARALGGRDSMIERLVRAYTLRGGRWRQLAKLDDWQSSATITDIDTATLAMANDVDMHLSGEVRETGRQDVDDLVAIAKAKEICARLGVPGLAATPAERSIPQKPLSREGRPTASFRIESGKVVPMVNPAFFEVLRAALDKRPAVAKPNTETLVQ